jgi:hypothetical protein
MPPPELGIHQAEQSGGQNSAAPSGHREIFLKGDDIEVTVKDLTSREVEFSTPIEVTGFLSLIRLRVPGAGEIGLYEPRHRTAVDL